jgi:septum formation protein
MLIRQNFPLILASTSKVRKKIMEDVGLEFKTVSPKFDEEIAKKKLKHLSIKSLALYLAEQKALSVSDEFRDSYVIGSDQICEFMGKNISKSNNVSEAIAQLKKFNGKTHTQNNAVAIALNGKIIFRNFSVAKLEMHKLSTKEIELYAKIDDSFGCAGSYKYESRGKYLFTKVSGDYFSILGLAIQPVLNFLYNKEIIQFKL